MVAAVGSEGVVVTLGEDHAAEVGELTSAVLAGVAGLLRALIELVRTAVGSIGVAVTLGERQLTHVAEVPPTILTIEFVHS